MMRGLSERKTNSWSSFGLEKITRANSRRQIKKESHFRIKETQESLLMLYMKDTKHHVDLTSILSLLSSLTLRSIFKRN